jgi:Leucine-rich repeat (LRR) protein
MVARALAFLFVATLLAGAAPSAGAQDKKGKPDLKKKFDLDGFVKKVGELPPDEQVKLVLEKMQEFNPGFREFVFARIEDGAVTQVALSTKYVTDISPIRAFANLKQLSATEAVAGKLKDISPLAGLKLETVRLTGNLELGSIAALKGMPLVYLSCNATKVASLDPLEGCKTLEMLHCDTTRVTSLKPLKGLKLRHLHCSQNKGAAGETITDLSPLQGMKLERFGCSGCAARDFSVLKEMPIVHLNIAETQIADFSVLKTLPVEELYLTKTRFTEKDGAFLKGKPLGLLYVSGTPIKDLQFANGLPLVTLSCDTCPLLKDLHGLKDSKLVTINFSRTPIKDLKPLEGLPLRKVHFSDTIVASLEPLKGAPLEEVYFGWHDLKGAAPLADLAPLAGKNIRVLVCTNSAVKDLKPLASAPLEVVHCQNTQIKDLTPLAGTPLRILKCQGTKVVDFKPLKDCPKLESLYCDFVPARDSAALKAITTLKLLNDADAATLLK